MQPSPKDSTRALALLILNYPIPNARQPFAICAHPLILISLIRVRFVIQISFFEFSPRRSTFPVTPFLSICYIEHRNSLNPQTMRSPHKLISLRAIIAFTLLSQACATVRISRPGIWAPAVHPRETWMTSNLAHTAASPATDFEKRTVWILFWGWNQQNIRPFNCYGNGLAEVRVSTNLGYALISVLTLGFVQPLTIEWECAKQTQAQVKDF